MFKQYKIEKAKFLSVIKLLVRAPLVAFIMSASWAANATITFTFNYSDPAGIGFNAAEPLGSARRTALEETGVLFSNLFPTLNASIVMSVNGAETNDSTLAAAGSNFNSSNASFCAVGFLGRGDFGIKALGGADPSPAAADGSVTVNFEDVMWDLDDTIDDNLFDFKSTMLHEILHAAGFSHSVQSNGVNPCQVSAPNPAGWAPYDQYLGNTTKTFIDASTFVIDAGAFVAAFTGGTGNTGVLWRGPQGLARNQSQPIPLFSPNPAQPGSSIAHLDDDFYTNVALLMEASTIPGPGVRTLSSIEEGILADIGYPTNNAPPPPVLVGPSQQTGDDICLPIVTVNKTVAIVCL